LKAAYLLDGLGRGEKEVPKNQAKELAPKHFLKVSHEGQQKQGSESTGSKTISESNHEGIQQKLGRGSQERRDLKKKIGNSNEGAKLHGEQRKDPNQGEGQNRVRTGKTSGEGQFRKSQEGTAPNLAQIRIEKEPEIV
jgi:hypothetical protein